MGKFLSKQEIFSQDDDHDDDDDGIFVTLTYIPANFVQVSCTRHLHRKRKNVLFTSYSTRPDLCPKIIIDNLCRNKIARRLNYSRKRQKLKLNVDKLEFQKWCRRHHNFLK